MKRNAVGQDSTTERRTADGIRRALWSGGRLAVLDVALLVVAVLLFTTDMTVLLFHGIFVLVTLGAFFWEFSAFVWRATFYISVTTIGVLLDVMTGSLPPEELVEVPLLSVILILVFIIARRRADTQALLQEQDQAFLKAVLENMEEAVIACDAAGGLAFSNSASRLFHGLPTEDLPLERWPEYYRLYLADGKTLVVAEDVPLPRALRGEQVMDEEFLIRPVEGPERLVAASGNRMVSASGEILGAVVVMRDITERKRAEQRLQRSLNVLLALNEASKVLSSTLELEELGTRLLEIMRRTCDFRAALISLRREPRELHAWRTVGSDELLDWARSTDEAGAARRAALENEEQRLFDLPPREPGAPCLVGFCLPLRVRDRLTGVLEVYGPQALAQDDTVDILESLSSQAANAIDNARLYEELLERENRLQDLVGQLIVAQDEERRRVAHDLHDGLAQTAAAAYQGLQIFARYHPPNSGQSQEDLDRVLDMLLQLVGETRRLIAGLRPTELDDFGLAAAIRQQVESLRAEGWQVSYAEDLGDRRLPAAVETALFRIVQEALTNVRKHAHTTRVRLRLRRLERSVRIEIRDWGQGFRPFDAANGGAPGEKVGLSGMRERTVLLGGQFHIHSEPGAGASVEAEIPVPELAPDEPHGSTTPSARLVIADNHDLLRDGLRTMLAREPGLTVVGEARNGREARDLCRKERPDLVLMDVRMPDMDGLEATRLIKEQCPETAIVMVTMHDSADYLLEALRVGAAGYVLKGSSRLEVVTVVRQVLRGESPLGGELVARLLRRLAADGKDPAATLAVSKPLTQRELEVLELLAEGMTNREIAQRLVVSPSTAKNHVQHIIAKLGVSDRTQAAVRALELGLLSSRANE